MEQKSRDRGRWSAVRRASMIVHEVTTVISTPSNALANHVEDQLRPLAGMRVPVRTVLSTTPKRLYVRLCHVSLETALANKSPQLSRRRQRSPHPQEFAAETCEQSGPACQAASGDYAPRSTWKPSGTEVKISADSSDIEGYEREQADVGYGLSVHKIPARPDIDRSITSVIFPQEGESLNVAHGAAGCACAHPKKQPARFRVPTSRLTALIS